MPRPDCAVPAVRRARPDDAGAIAEWLEPTLPRPWSASEVEAEIRHPGGRGWLIEGSAGGVRAALLARRAADEMEILQLAVAIEARRAGLGSTLMERASGESGVERIQLEVREDNGAARAFYQALGFREVGRRTAYYRDGATAILLSRNAVRTR